VDYTYRVTSLRGRNIDHVVVAISADQEVIPLNENAQLFPPCVGDNVTGFLRHVCHDVAKRFNPTHGSTSTVTVRTIRSSAVLTSILVRGGNTQESCAIAGPGIFDANPDQAVLVSQTEQAGACEVVLQRDRAGNIVSISTKTPGCTVDRNGADIPTSLVINGDPVRFLGESKATTGSATCYSWFSGGRWYAVSTVTPSDCPQ
jgi:hypothetical protein